ncbi:lactate racemase domain-containing protein, partial [Methanothrix sp.]|uniref:lactate racemase domain-containing protein n=1 Tax=Methanothrix sp. TaxID=90426 RepID=UPI0034E2133B
MNMLLGYGNSSVRVELQDGWEVVQPNELPPAHDGEIDRALDSPFGAGLEDLSGRSAAVIVSDITRPSPSHRILPPLVRRLRGIGVNDIKIVFALGTHRRMTDAEIRHLLRGCVRLPH